MKAQVYITLKPGVLDPQGKAIEQTLNNIGFDGIEGIRQGKYIEIELTETDKTKARKIVKEMCDKLLANTVMEHYTIKLIQGK